MRLCKRCGSKPSYKTSSYCPECKKIDDQERRAKKHALNNEIKCPVCRRWSAYDPSHHACDTCIENAVTRQSIMETAQWALSDKRDDERRTGVKTCSMCKETKPLDEFTKYKRRDPDTLEHLRDIRESRCKDCQRNKAALKRNTYDPTTVLPWRVSRLNNHVFVISHKELDAKTIRQVFKRKHVSIPKNPDDYMLYVYVPHLRNVLLLRSGSLDGCLLDFKRAFIDPMNRKD